MRNSLSVPKKLFRYRSLRNSYSIQEIEKVLERQQIFMASSDWVNDPFDFKPVYEKSSLRKINQRIKANTPNRKGISRQRMSELGGRKLSRSEYRELTKPTKKAPLLLAKLEDYASRETLKRLKSESLVTCFSEIGDNIPMWSHYADQHSGACLEFDVEVDKRHDATEVPWRVLYTDDRPTLSTLDMMIFSDRHETQRHKTGSDRNESKSRVLEKLFLAKSIDWSYEREWRFFEYPGVGARYKKLPCLKLAAITLGLRASDSKIEEILRRFGESVKVRRAILSKSQFSINYQILS
ncbi:DUF2971 domain-containing protein [Candidatus Rhodobacter oscarellae]|uniref:DUF2971 domain-containing protein n=1 Tax=Candidatus Rhodobacter oscarellae TaxID=1675527 RepID=UPI000A935B06|nr:DUF2971 domain-containing protein [Candidatus Rhodobacter lobularis]